MLDVIGMTRLVWLNTETPIFRWSNLINTVRIEKFSYLFILEVFYLPSGIYKTSELYAGWLADWNV